MKNVFLSVLTLSLSLAACTNPTTDSVEAAGSANGIYDGEITTAENPISHTTVLIYGSKEDSDFTCTGSVLSPTVILTAAHCVIEIDKVSRTAKTLAPKKLRILDPDKAKTTAIDTAIIAEGAKVIAHPLYIAQKYGLKKAFYTVGYDLALIQLSTPLPETYKSVIISDELDALSSNQVYIAGFGSYMLDPKVPIDYNLHHGAIKVNLADKQVFNTLNGSDVPVSKPQFSTNTTSSPNLSFVKNSPDATFCEGDSGGPLYYIKGGEIYLAGVNVAMVGNKDPENLSCTTEGNGYNLTVSMAGPSLGFILDTYKELTGFALPLVRDNPVMDPNTFDFYLNAPVLSSKNIDVNLEGYTVVKDNRDNTVIILDLETAAKICENPDSIQRLPGLYVYVSPTLESYLDGKTILPIMVSHNGVIERIVEGRMKLNGDKVKMVVHTSEGYISAELPAKTCNFPAATN